MKKILKYISLNDYFWILLFVLVFLLIRIPGLDSPLHQDEYKWPMIASPEWQSDMTIPHPPLSQFIYRTAGYIVGFDIGFRLVPLFFGSINLVLLFYFLKRFFGRKEAVVGSAIWVSSYFSVLASLVVDTDGQIMPFFFLLAVISYYHLREDGSKKMWWFVLLLSLVLGFFIKLSFLLAIGAIIVDFLWSKKDTFSKQQYIKFVSYIGGGVLLLGLLLFVSQYVFTFFNVNQSVAYWKHFLVADRGWMQTAIQCVKAVFFMSPLLLLPLLGLKEVFKKVGVFVFFLCFAFVFYIVLFDFSIGALDRYLQLLILPITVMSAILLAPIIFSEDIKLKKFLLIGIGVSVLLFLLQYINHFVPPLHPKAEWISRIMSLRWNFLYPFSGGSGPLGFYISFLFLGLSWLISVTTLFFAAIKPHMKNGLVVLILPIIFVYNLVFIEEYLFGNIYGSAPQLILPAAEFIKNNPDIKKVTVYNDNGGNEIQLTGKYERRLYIDPKFEVNIQEKIDYLNTHKEHYFVLDIPRFASSTLYQRYFDTCTVVYDKIDNYISARIYDCRGVPNIKN